MKIAYLSHSVLPSTSANSVHVMKMCSAFASHQHDVTLYGCSDFDNQTDCFDFYGVEKNFDIVSWKLPAMHGRFLLLALLVFVRTYFFHRPNIIVARGLFSLYLCSLVNIPFIYESHSPPRTRLHFWLERKLFKKNNFQQLIVITLALKKHYQNIFTALDDGKIRVLADGADPAREPALSKNTLTEPIKIGYTGSLHKGKGSEILIPLIKKMKGYQFHVVGGSEPDVKQMKNSCLGCSNLVLYGHVPHREINTLIQSFDIVLAPYQDDVTSADGTATIASWMSPLKIFEYMAAGRAIIASKLPSIEEVIIDGHNAILCDSTNLIEWETSIEDVAKNNELRKRLSENALKDFDEKYSWAIRAGKYLDITAIQKVLESGTQ
jgi:glycosyltransferase involved in cell wall biosynthesis